MWIFMNNSFLSIVQDKYNPQQLHMRARREKDIQRVFPEAEVLVGQGSDYKYRAFLPREIVVEILAKRMEEIDYTNFKASVEERERHDSYMEVWGIMNRFQR